ncbi:MAG: hypothetical protein AAGH99_01445 [Planctomycetota bacterium]
MLSNEVNPTVVSQPAESKPGVKLKLARMRRIEWLGQTAASLCWIVSVFVYGLSSTGDYLQLCAASAWLIANLAAVISDQDD